MNHLIRVTKSDGTVQLFEEEKLENSLKSAGAPAQAIDEVLEEVGKEIKDGMSTTEIYRRAFVLLRKHSTKVASKYSIRRAMFELGPDGFPFEKFVARVFNAWGYDAVTDQHLMGSCVEHEVDVVAWKDDLFALTEVKFHNEFGLKTDLKVSLYVKARFEDLAETIFEYGGKRRKLSQGYLFTNTKFTESAVTYGTCKNIKMIGWNYPQEGNLHDIIEQYNLFPITTLTSVTHQQKKDLIAEGALICSDIAANPNLLNKIGIKDSEVQRIMSEISSLT